MSYTIHVTNATPIVIDTGATYDFDPSNQNSFKLVGKNVPNYGQLIAQDFVNLLQSSAGSTSPGGPVQGQLWYNSSSYSLSVYNGSNFDKLASIVSQTIAPTNPPSGQLWYDTTKQQLNVFNGSNFVIIGPIEAASSPLQTDNVVDSLNNIHQTARIMVDNANVAVLSSQTFVARTAYAGFTNITSGLMIAGSLSVSSNMTVGNNLTVTGIANLTASNAKYADLAEYYTSDIEYETGTVVMIGGDAEVTAADIVGTTRVVGVVSNNPAYLMNNDCKGTRVAVALQGRVPCKVIGSVSRGDLLTASDMPGIAISTVNPNAGSIIGKALQSYDSTEVGNIEIIVGKH
jgi:energy-converting hydrogenase Eha subunit E